VFGVSVALGCEVEGCCVHVRSVACGLAKRYGQAC
jgi:hypothetical protein